MRARTEQNNPDIICQAGATLTAYADLFPTPGDGDMLLNGERPRIKWDTEEGNIGQVASPGVANWETYQHREILISQDSI